MDETYDNDRIKCKENMINYIKSKNITTQNTDTVELIKMAYNCEDNMEKKLINKLWQNDNNMLDKIKNVIPVVDISQSLKKEKILI